MDYRELLNRCKTKPEWLWNVKQQKAHSEEKYRDWVIEDNKRYHEEKKYKEFRNKMSK